MGELDHAQLGRISHLQEDGVFLFRGLRYASLRHAFAEPKVYSDKVASTSDATKHGPAALSPPGGCAMELQLIQKTLPHEILAQSAVDCLNLNVCVPEGTKEKLPVMLFFHGGGYRIGSGAWPQYDLQKFVKLSSEIGRPIIGIQANYRLGVYGFLHSQALVEAGAPGNRGLRDQRAAIQWIHRNIAGFGGDPKRITVIGESAGGVSCTLQLQSKEPLFDQLISMGGTSLLMKPLPPFVAEPTYQAVLSNLGIDASLSPQDQLEKLLSTSSDDILSKIGSDVPLLPVLDGDVITSSPNFKQFESPSELRGILPGARWCRRVMLGDCQHDGSILEYALFPRLDSIYQYFVKTLQTHLSDKVDDVNTILEGYDLKSDDSSVVAMKKILEFVTDVQFYGPTIAIAQGWPTSSFVYHFNEPNPWEGPLKGQANHILDVAFLFQNFNDHLEKGQRETAVKFAKDVITFINGQDPYPTRLELKRGAQIYGPPGETSAKFVESEDPSQYNRSALVWDLASRFGWDKLSFTLDMFVAGN